ncbi:unnamed protein product [Withania somnifera]
MGWGNIYKRRVKVFAVALIIYFDYKAIQLREKWVNKSKKASLWEKAHERNARRVLNLIVELEGLWVKLGQYLSTRADVLPEAYTCLLKQLQDSLPPRSLKEVCQTIEKEFGKTMDDLFLDFDKVPLATASIAQVHRATLSDGQESCRQSSDLKNAKAIVDWIAWAEPQYNFHPMIDEWCKEAPKELDFNHEAENTKKVSRNLHCNKGCNDSKPANHVDVLIPEVIQSTEKVLILEYMDGVRLNDTESLQALGADKQRLVEEITRAYAHQIYVDGFFNGDPHPGNFLVSKEPPHRPILLDFGLTKLLSSSLKQALAKMFLAAAEGDHVALLAAFAEMGFKFRLDVPEQVMEVTSYSSVLPHLQMKLFSSNLSLYLMKESMKMLSEQRSKNLKVIQEKMKLNEKEVKRFNPVDAFPCDIVIFGRVLNLLRGLSATMDVRIVYIDIMRPFAESVLQCNLNRGPALNPQWIYDTPIHSDVEAKLRKLLVELGNAEKILGIQVCAYKDGEVIIDTAAGVLGKYDPRPVQPDSLFSVFSTTKGICAGLVHWLVDNGKLKLEESIANIWPEFGSNGKDQIKVHHVLNHTSGLHNAVVGVNQDDPLLMTDWDECLKRTAMSAPETAPGHEQLYHFLSFGWLCGGIIERASGRRFQELLEEAFVRPLKIDGELYVGIPPGVESRLATLTVDMSDLTKLSSVGNRSDLPSSFQPQQIAQLAATLPAIFNSLYARRAIIPAANGHCSARALARYYAALAEGGRVPPAHCSSMPPLGSHQHIPKFPSQRTVKKKKSRMTTCLGDGPGPSQNSSSSIENSYGRDGKGNAYIQIPSDNSCSNGDMSSDSQNIKLFHNPRVHDAFMGVGEYENMTYRNGDFGLGFKRSYSTNDELIGFGHSGMGGSTGFCNIKHKFAMAITLNKLSFGNLNIPVPKDISKLVETGSTSQLEIGKPLIN